MAANILSRSVALAFLGPAFAAITLSAFGPEMFDEMNIKREIVSHGGSIFSAILSGGIVSDTYQISTLLYFTLYVRVLIVAYLLKAWIWYPNIEAVFILPFLFASSAIFFSRFIPRGDPLMGRGL